MNIQKKFYIVTVVWLVMGCLSLSAMQVVDDQVASRAINVSEAPAPLLPEAYRQQIASDQEEADDGGLCSCYADLTVCCLVGCMKGMLTLWNAFSDDVKKEIEAMGKTTDDQLRKSLAYLEEGRANDFIKGDGLKDPELMAQVRKGY